MMYIMKQNSNSQRIPEIIGSSNQNIYFDNYLKELKNFCVVDVDYSKQILIQEKNLGELLIHDPEASQIDYWEKYSEFNNLVAEFRNLRVKAESALTNFISSKKAETKDSNWALYTFDELVSPIDNLEFIPGFIGSNIRPINLVPNNLFSIQELHYSNIIFEPIIPRDIGFSNNIGQPFQPSTFLDVKPDLFPLSSEIPAISLSFVSPFYLPDLRTLSYLGQWIQRGTDNIKEFLSKLNHKIVCSIKRFPKGKIKKFMARGTEGCIPFQTWARPPTLSNLTYASV